MTMFNSKLTKLRKTAYLASASALFVGMLSSCNNVVDYTEQEVLDPTQGVITEIKELEEDKFRITDEIIVPQKEDSRIIAEYMDGTRDTLTMQEAQLVDANDERRGGMRGIFMYGLMGYMMGKSMGTPISRGAYASEGAFNKSQTANNQLRNTATRRTVRTPKSGYGSKKSTRSYGG